MGHFSNVKTNLVAGNIPAQGYSQLAFCFPEHFGVNDFPHSDDFCFLIGHLNAHRRFIGNRRFNPHSGGSQVQGDVVCQTGNLTDLHSGAGLKLIPGDSGPPGNIHHPGLNPEAL